MTATSTAPPALVENPGSVRPIAEPIASPGRRCELVTLVVACVVSAYFVHAHAMWFDEIQAWNIARASHSLGGLWSNLRYEGHPVLWYLPLYALTRVTGDPRAMQVLQWTIACGVYALVLLRAPFAFWMRVVVVAGYFLAFEYGVISRSYGLGVLLALLAVHWLARPTPAWARTGVALALLAFVSLAGAVLAVAVAVSLGWSVWRGQLTVVERDRRRAGAVVGAVLVAAAAAAATCVPPPDFVSFSLGIPTTPFDGLSATRFAASAAGVWRGLFPIPLGMGRWNTNLLDDLPAHEWWQALVAIGIVILVTSALRTRPFARTLWLVGTLGAFAFSVLVVLPDRSHYAGAFFVLFLVCVWCAVAPPGRAPADLPELTGGSTGLMRIATVVFVAQVVATVAILPYNSVHPFAPDRTLAQVAAARGMRDRIVSGQDYDGVTMSGYLDVPVYSVARHDWIRYFHNDQREADGNGRMTDRVLQCTSARLAHQRAESMILVSDRPLASEPGFRRIASTDGVNLYEVAPAGALVERCVPGPRQ